MSAEHRAQSAERRAQSSALAPLRMAPPVWSVSVEELGRRATTASGPSSVLMRSSALAPSGLWPLPCGVSLMRSSARALSSRPLALLVWSCAHTRWCDVWTCGRAHSPFGPLALVPPLCGAGVAPTLVRRSSIVLESGSHSRFSSQGLAPVLRASAASLRYVQRPYSGPEDDQRPYPAFDPSRVECL